MCAYFALSAVIVLMSQANKFDQRLSGKPTLNITSSPVFGACVYMLNK